MPIRTAFSSLLSASVVASLVAVPGTARAQQTPPVALMAANAVEDPAAVLGLDGPDASAASNLTSELRKAFGRRGLGGSEQLSLAEVRLTMGCEGNDEACLAEAGKSIGVQKLIYGELQPASGGGYSLTLHILNVPKVVEETTTTRPLTKNALSAGNITATATEIVDSLFPKEDDPEAPVPFVANEPTDPQPYVEPRDEPTKSGLVWGKYSPRPTWKWAGFGVGVGLTVAGAVGAATTSAMLSGRLKDDVFNEAEKSLEDCVVTEGGMTTVGTCEGTNPDRFEENDVDPNMEGDLCSYAGEKGIPGQDPNAVRNKAVNDACTRASTTEKINVASFAILGAGAALTIVFTTLLFVHKENPTTRAMRKHDVRFSALPDPRGGFTVGGGFKF